MSNKRIMRPKRDVATARPVAAAVRKLVIPRPNVLHSYLDHRQVNQYLEYLENRYGHFVKVHQIGHSHERRAVCGIEIDWMNENNTELPMQLRPCSAPPSIAFQEQKMRASPFEKTRNIVFIEAGTHAREWITISTALNCIYQLTERYTRNVELLRKLRFFIVPLVNPDGYEFSRSKNRQWRKNRRPQKQSKFIGTDCNRNYDIYWEHGSAKMNRNTYKGEKAFSEPETRAMRNILDKYSPHLLFFLSLHSYGQSIMYPWGYSKEPTEYHRELHTLAQTGRNAIKSYNGREYRTGSIAGLTKRTISGSVVDYVYGVLRTPMALVMELPSHDLGFQPPVEMISQIGHESWFGIREMCKRAYDLRASIRRETERGLPTPPPLKVTMVSRGVGGDDAPAEKPVSEKAKEKDVEKGAGDASQNSPPKKLKRRARKLDTTIKSRYETALDSKKRSTRIEIKTQPDVETKPKKVTKKKKTVRKAATGGANLRRLAPIGAFV